MADRYITQDLFLNTNEMYRDTFNKRGVAFVRHYGTPTLKHPTSEELARIAMRKHVWRTGDRFFKLAQEFYGDSRYWWVIAWANRTPTEAHVEFGDSINIPLDLEIFLEIIES